MNEPPENVGAKIDDAYLLALGRFVHEFAAIEGRISFELGYLADVSFGAGIALVSGVRAAQTMGLINRLLEATERLGEKERLSPAFAQLGHINAMRNSLLHHGAEPDSEAGVVVYKVGHTHERTEVRRISVSMLDNMTHDLEIIGLHLLYTHIQHDPESKSEAWFQNELRVPWRYKPPQPFVPGWWNTLPTPKPQDPPAPSEA